MSVPGAKVATGKKSCTRLLCKRNCSGGIHFSRCPIPSRASSNSDLWIRTWHLVQTCQDRVSIHKAPAHADCLLGDDEVLQRAINCNKQVDASAHTANLHRSADSREVRNCVRRSSNEQERIGRLVMKFHVPRSGWTTCHTLQSANSRGKFCSSSNSTR